MVILAFVPGKTCVSKKQFLVILCLTLLTCTMYSMSAPEKESPMLRLSTDREPNWETANSRTYSNVRVRRSIPKIIHQIWNDEIVPGQFVDNIKSLVRDNPPPDWKYYWWTKESGLKLVKEKFPNWIEIISDVSNIMRSDILRYLIIYEFGGVYFDLDTVCVKSLNNFVETHRCSLALEPAEHNIGTKRQDFLLTNAALLCIRRHPFFSSLISNLNKLNKSCKLAFRCTGPEMISLFFREFNKTAIFSDDIPDVEISEIFQDVYDDRIKGKSLFRNCFNNTNSLPFKTKICANWIARGKEKRNLSQLAITYHTWSHINDIGKLVISNETHVKNVIPHARIYGKDL